MPACLYKRGENLGIVAMGIDLRWDEFTNPTKFASVTVVHKDIVSSTRYILYKIMYNYLYNIYKII